MASLTADLGAFVSGLTLADVPAGARDVAKVGPIASA